MKRINFEHEKIAILKFGHSILANRNDISKIVSEAYLFLKNDYKVMVVVSAIGGTTKELKNLMDLNHDEHDTQRASHIATVLGTGETTSAALVTLEFIQAGIKATRLEHTCLTTDEDNLLNSNPVRLDTHKIFKLFNTHSVLVLPGFIGSSKNYSTTLLGFGGSDLSAIFCAHKLKAQKCILYKDSQYIYKDFANNEVYNEITYADCLNIAYPVIQHKSLDYAREHKIKIQIKGLYTNVGTLVGTRNSQTTQVIKPASKKIKVLLLGLGTVGLGLYRHLLKNDAMFEIVGIGVRDIQKHAHHNLSADLISNDIAGLLERNYDVLISLVGGDIEEKFIYQALKTGHHVVTANKLLIAENWQNLIKVANQHKASLSYSAAVAGVIPILETILELKRNNNNVINSISGVLNGTCNFILDKMNSGISSTEALNLAQSLGYAEADPSLDLNGIDAYHKIKIISRVAFGRDPDRIEVDGIHKAQDQIEGVLKRNNLLKLIANVSAIDNSITAKVKLEEIQPDSCWAKINGADNCININLDNKTKTLLGSGAGRWPTSLAVYSDLLNLVLEQRV